MTAPLILHVFPSFVIGGAQVRFAALANRFGRQWRHAIVSLDGRTDCAARLSTDLDVTYPPVALRKGSLLYNVREIRRLLRAMRPDVLVTSNWGAIEWALANLSPIARHIHTEDGFGPEERSVQIRRRVLTRRLALRRSRVVLPSNTLLRIARDQWRLEPARLHLIPNGVDLARFRPQDPASIAEQRARWAAGSEPVIGIVAALRPEKNIGRLLRAFGLSGPSGHLVILGDGAERAALQRLTLELGLEGRVHFAGHVADPAPLYGAFDIFALSSDTEQMPLSVLEAMAAGLPVAATDVGDIRMMVAPDNTAFIAPVTDDGLAASLRSLLGDAALRRRLGDANRSRAAAVYQQETMFQAYAGLINDSVVDRGGVTS